MSIRYFFFFSLMCSALFAVDKQQERNEKLWSAIKMGQDDKALALLKRANPCAVTDCNEDALFIASRYGRNNVVKKLLENEAVKKRINIIGYYQTPLAIAVQSREYSTAHILLAHGADQTIAGHCNVVPIWNVISSFKHRRPWYQRGDSVKMLKALLNAPDADKALHTVSTGGASPNTAIDRAVDYTGNVTVFDILVDHGAQFTIKHAFGAARGGHVVILHKLFAKFPDLKKESSHLLT